MTDDTRLGIGGNNPPEPTLIERLTEAAAPLAKEVEEIAAKANALPKMVGDDAELDAVGVVVKQAASLTKRLDGMRTDEKAPFLQATRDVDAFFKAFTDRTKRIIEALEVRASEYVRAKAAEERRRLEEEAKAAREKAEAERAKAEAAAEAGRVQTAARADARAEVAEDRARRLEDSAEQSNADLVRSRGASGTLATATTKLDVRVTDFAKADLEKLRPYLDRDAVLKAARAWLRVTKGTEALAGFEVFDDVKARFR